MVAPNSPPSCRRRSASASGSSVGSGPSPTRVIYAFATPITSSISVGPIPTPEAAPPAVVVEEVTNGYVPWSMSSSAPCAPSSRTRPPAESPPRISSPASVNSSTMVGRTVSSCDITSSASTRRSSPSPASATFARNAAAVTISCVRSRLRRSPTRRPVREILSRYAGPIPRPVVPIFFEPRLSSCAASSSR